MAEEGREGRKKGRKGGCHLLFNKHLFHKNYCHLEFFMFFSCMLFRSETLLLLIIDTHHFLTEPEWQSWNMAYHGG